MPMVSLLAKSAYDSGLWSSIAPPLATDLQGLMGGGEDTSYVTLGKLLNLSVSQFRCL